MMTTDRAERERAVERRLLALERDHLTMILENWPSLSAGLRQRLANIRNGLDAIDAHLSGPGPESGGERPETCSECHGTERVAVPGYTRWVDRPCESCRGKSATPPPPADEPKPHDGMCDSLDPAKCSGCTPSADEPCQHPARRHHGRHEWYGQMGKPMVCRACGAIGQILTPPADEGDEGEEREAVDAAVQAALDWWPWETNDDFGEALKRCAAHAYRARDAVVRALQGEVERLNEVVSEWKGVYHALGMSEGIETPARMAREFRRLREEVDGLHGLLRLIDQGGLPEEYMPLVRAATVAHDAALRGGREEG